MTITTRRFFRCLLGAAITTGPGAASAQDAKPIQLIQEAFLGDLAFTQERGEIQISSLMRADGAAVNRTASIPLGMEYGITDDIQVSIETGGFNYARPTGWSSPRAFGMGLRYGRYGLLPNLHAALTIAAETDGGAGDKRIVDTKSGLQLGVDVPRLRMTHIFTSIVRGLWNSEGIQSGVDWNAGLVVPLGTARVTIERTVRAADSANRGTVPGLVWKVADGLDIGVATTLRTQPSVRLSGAMLSLVLEF
jgi:hypothetical protein